MSTSAPDSATSVQVSTVVLGAPTVAADPLATDPAIVDPAVVTDPQVDPNADPAIKDPAETPAPLTEYADFEIPEGVTVDPEAMTAFKATALELGLTQEQAQALTNQGAAMAQRITEQAAAAQVAQTAAWLDSSKSDHEFGGTNFEANVAVAAKAMDQFATPEFRQILDQSGLGNHPEMIRTFYRLGLKISEGKPVGGNANPGTAAQTMAQKMYPSLN